MRFRFIDYEDQFSKHPVVVNHYPCQSEEWYFKVKATRGTATWHGDEYMSAERWFKKRWDEMHRVPTDVDLDIIRITEKLRG